MTEREKEVTENKFYIQYHTDEGWGDRDYVKYPADVYIAMMEVFGCEDFAMDMQIWCEEAKPGDKFEDEDVRVVAL